MNSNPRPRRYISAALSNRWYFLLRLAINTNETRVISVPASFGRKKARPVLFASISVLGKRYKLYSYTIQKTRELFVSVCLQPLLYELIISEKKTDIDTRIQV